MLTYSTIVQVEKFRFNNSLSGCNMDHFGIGAAFLGMARVYAQSARQTGRTSSLVESMRDGDRVVFANRREALRVEQLFLERGVSVSCVVVSPQTPQDLFNFGTPQGRTVFDHTWVEEFYSQALSDTQQKIDRLERQTSGYGQAHRETKRLAVELARWRL